MAAERVGNYVLLHKLPICSSSLVYEATPDSEHSLLACEAMRRGAQKTVVVKIVRKTEQLRKDHRSEVEALFRLQNKRNIVKVLDYLESDDALFIVLEKASAGDLMSRLLRPPPTGTTASGSGPLEPAEAKRIAHELCKAVKSAHDCGIAHLDIKPENVLLQAEALQGSLKVLLADFGSCFISQQANNKYSCSHETSSSRLLCRAHPIGTQLYRAPEVQPGQPFDPFAADIWSLGVTIYVLLVGTWPFAGSTYEEVAAAAAAGHPTLLECPAISANQCRDLLQRCLTSDPIKRPSIRDVVSHPFLAQRPSPNSSAGRDNPWAGCFASSGTVFA